MSIYDIIFWVGSLILIAIFIIWLRGVRKAKASRYRILDVACAGTLDPYLPAKERVKLDLENAECNCRQQIQDGQKAYLVRGNSMQYADIHNGDIVYVDSVNIEDLKQSLPKITLLTAKPERENGAGFKIRRTWKVLSKEIGEAELNSAMQEILNSVQFSNLRRKVGPHCPGDEDLKAQAVEKLRIARQNEQKEALWLLSTTYRTQSQRLEISLHPVSTLQGIVTCALRRK